MPFVSFSRKTNNMNMNREAAAAITAMLNSFPQQANDYKALLQTYDKILIGLSDRAITETAMRYTAGDVPGQSRDFAPSIAQFNQQAKLMDEVIPLRGRERLEPPSRFWAPTPKPEDRIRMGFKMSVLSEGLKRKLVDRVAEANKRGIDDMMALAQEWGVPIPESLFRRKSA